MKPTFPSFIGAAALVLGALSLSSLPLVAADEPPLLFDPNDEAQAELISGKEMAAVVEEGGKKVLQITFPAKQYPTLGIPAPDGVWDLSKYQGVEVEVTNKGEESILVALRVDNKGEWQDEPWSTENLKVEAGDTQTLSVTFGLSHGGKPSYELDPSQIIAVQLFAVNPKVETPVLFANLRPFGEK